jgi:SAM-dependent methyltransferase
MERSEYDKLDRVENRMWWFAARNRNLLMLLRRLPSKPGCWPTLDAGSGTGGFLSRLAADDPARVLLGLDIDPLACRRAAAKSGRPLCAGSVNSLPFPDGAFAVIFSLDVLCHRDVDEYGALLQFHRCLAKHGWLIVNLPAYQWMLSQHDVAVHNVRRYTMAGVARLLNTAGFRCVYATYWNTLLFPVMAITRKLLPHRIRPTSDVMPYPNPVDALCRAVTTFETVLLRVGLRLPFGGSVLALAAKKASIDG